MKRLTILLAFVCVFVFAAVQAQETTSITRIEKQRGPSRFQTRHLKQTEESLLPALRGELQGGQQMAIQTLRDLEQMFPDYPFESTISILASVLKDETASPISRRLAALALDELHSNAGDVSIREVAMICEDKGLQTLCNALLVKSDNREVLGLKD